MLYLLVCLFTTVTLYPQKMITAEEKELLSALRKVNHYELLDLSYEELRKEVLNLVQQSATYIKALDEWKDALKTENTSVIKKAADKKEKIREKIENDFFKEKIKKACENTQKRFRDDLTVAQEQLKAADEFEQIKKREAVVVLEYKINRLKAACPILLDAKKRQQYDQQLLKPAEERDDYFMGVQRGIEDAMLYAPDKKILLNQIVGDLLSQIEIPGPAAKVFNQELAIRNISFLPIPAGPDVRYGLGFSGLIALNKFDVRLSVYLVRDIFGSFKFSFIVDLPKMYKISDLFPTFTKLDAFKFPQAKFIIASFEGLDQDGFYFKKGFNFGALLDLSGPLKLLDNLKNKAAKLKSLVFEAKPITLQGVIPLKLSQAEFTAKIPMYIGIDLREISVIPKTLSNVIQKVTSDDFELSIMPVTAKKAVGEGPEGERVTETVKPYIEILKAEQRVVKTAPGEEVQRNIGEKIIAEGIIQEGEVKRKVTTVGKVKTVASIPLGFKIQVETGIRITLGTQSEPLRINVLGSLVPISKDHPEGLLTVGGLVKGMLQLKWLAIGNAGISFDFDGALMPVAAAVGIPFTGIGIRGELDLGKQGDARATLGIAGGFSVSPSYIPVDLVLDVSGTNIRFANMISYASTLAAKAKLLKEPIPLERIPTLTLHKIWGYCAFKDTTIAGKQYRAGLGLQVETELFNRKAGIRLFINDKFRTYGWGYIPHINFNAKGKEIFRLSGLTADKGPRISFNFDPEKPLEGMFGLQGIVSLPTLGVRQKTDFSWQGFHLNADFETEVAGFSVLFGIRMNTKEGVERLSPYDELKREAEELLAAIDKTTPIYLAATKLMEAAASFERANRYQEARSRVDRAIRILSEAREKKPDLPQKLPYEVAVRAQGVTIAQYENIKSILVDLLQLFKKAQDMLKQDTVAYRAALMQQRRAMGEYKALPQTIENIRRDLIREFQTKAAKTITLPPKEGESQLEEEKKVTSPLDVNIVAKLLEIELPKAILPKVEAILEKLQFAKNVLVELVGGVLGGDYLAKKREIETDPTKKWKKLYVKFGFKGDFATFLNKHAVTTLRKVNENAAKKLDQLSKKMAELQAKAVGSVDKEIDQVKASLAQKKQEIATLQAECQSLAATKRIKCRARIAAQKAIIAKKKLYLNTLLKPGKQVVTGVTRAAATVTKELARSKALIKATEAIFGGTATALEMLAKGLNFFNVTEVLGEYSWDDMQALKLPRLVRFVARIDLPGMPMDVVLSDLQFDFKNPAQSAAQIVTGILTSFIENQQNKYISRAVELAR